MIAELGTQQPYMVRLTIFAFIYVTNGIVEKSKVSGQLKLMLAPKLLESINNFLVLKAFRVFRLISSVYLCQASIKRGKAVFSSLGRLKLFVVKVDP